MTADLMDLRKLRNHFILSTASLQEQLVKSYELGKTADGKDLVLDLETVGQFFRDILSGKTVPRTLDGTISFEDLKNHYTEI